MVVSQACRETEKSLVKHKTSFEGISFRKHRVNGREGGTEAGRVFFLNSHMESDAGDLTAEELEDQCKQYKILLWEIDHCSSVHVCAYLRTCVCTSDLKHSCCYLV